MKELPFPLTGSMENTRLVEENLRKKGRKEEEKEEF